MGFTKLDEGIVQSSIMSADAYTFKVWITLLAMCKETGIAYVSPVFLASVCHLPISKVRASLQKLSEPDLDSRSTNEDGRRIRRVDGGFEIINYLTYRTVSLRSAEAERKRLYRLATKGCPDGVRICPDTSASDSASNSDSSMPNKSIDISNTPQRLTPPVPNSDIHIEAIQAVFEQFNYHVRPEKPLKVGDPECDRGMRYANERLNDGYTVADLCHVIEVMTEAWTGDLYMRKFLRPEVLFSKAKFAGYLAKRTLAQEGAAWAADMEAKQAKEGL